MKKERHAAKVQMLAAALAKRYGKAAFDFVTLQIEGSEDANRHTWLAVLEALPR